MVNGYSRFPDRETHRQRAVLSPQPQFFLAMHTRKSPVRSRAYSSHHRPVPSGESSSMMRTSHSRKMAEKLLQPSSGKIFNLIVRRNRLRVLFPRISRHCAQFILSAYDPDHLPPRPLFQSAGSDNLIEKSQLRSLQLPPTVSNRVIPIQILIDQEPNRNTLHATTKHDYRDRIPKKVAIRDMPRRRPKMAAPTAPVVARGNITNRVIPAKVALRIQGMQVAE